MAVDVPAIPIGCLAEAQEASKRRAVNALALHAVQKMTADALFADLALTGVEQLVIGTDQLEIVGGEHDAAGISRLPLPLDDLHDHGGGQLVIEVVQMDDLRLKIVQHQAELLSGLCGVDRLQGVADLGHSLRGVKIHRGGIGVDRVPHASLGVFHAEILNVMPDALQVGAQLKHIGFRTAVGVQKFIDHQNSHRVASCSNVSPDTAPASS